MEGKSVELDASLNGTPQDFSSRQSTPNGERMQSIDSLFKSEEIPENENRSDSAVLALHRKYKKLLLLLWLNTKFPDGLGQILTDHEIQTDYLKEWHEFFERNPLLSKSSLDSSILDSVQPIHAEQVLPPASPTAPSESVTEPPVNEGSQEYEDEEVDVAEKPEIDLPSYISEKETIQPTLPEKDAIQHEEGVVDQETQENLRETGTIVEEENANRPSTSPTKRPQTPDSEYAALQLTKEQKSNERPNLVSNADVGLETIQIQPETSVTDKVGDTETIEQTVVCKSPTEPSHEISQDTTEASREEESVGEVTKQVIEETDPSSIIANNEKPEAEAVDQRVQQVDSLIPSNDEAEQRNSPPIPLSTTEKPFAQEAPKSESQKKSEGVKMLPEAFTSSKPLFQLSISLPFSLLPPSELSVQRKPEDTLDAWLLRTEMIPLHDDLENAYKYVSTNNWMHAYREKIVRESIRSVFNAKEKGTWSFRQPKRQKEMVSTKTHHDYILDEMQWMSIDFSQERRWKIVLAKQMVDSVMDYHTTSDKSTVCTPSSLSKNKKPYLYNGSRKNSMSSVSNYPSPDSASMMQDQYNALQSSSPLRDTDFCSTIFSDDVIATTNVEESRNSILNVPTYNPPNATENQLRTSAITYPIEPISRFALAKTRLKSSCIHTERKRLFSERDTVPHRSGDQSKNDEAFEDIDLNSEFRGGNTNKKRAFAPFTVRPPYPPLATENTSEVIWLPEEDELLLLLLRQYSFNWEFIASRLTPSGLYVSKTERRTAWDCFERWIRIDPQAANVQFTGSHARLAQQKLEESLQRSHQSMQNIHMRDSTTPVPHLLNQSSYFVLPTVSRQYRPIAIFEAIKKILKQREFAQKTATKRQNANVSTSSERLPPVPSPIELSRLKFEREAQIQQVQSQRNANLYMQHQNQTKMRPGAPISGTPQHQLAAYQAAVSQNSSATSSTGTSPVPSRAVPRLPNRLDYPNSPRLAAEQIQPFQQR
ncbi:NuA4 histone acetyltransferase complex subunit Vid21 [Schizosaccharomyces cryophilus OY26]|uniref:Vacuolar import and degradation protein 21 n=1 Tax=Schizosaccharomyces cryophilus (strain OY26 / ATCC MYA-4695 / CBS 11777 / NBRC 106824 / NRRL Y48691) TaxID=653667 RepID=S9X7J4_SCHCR|nr:NuA4 histone acetyltransferase complex subunit Vid21 [Schizosaccharomyces cryophilus OY26]EPY49751.1 NuA4 histone acetyltransferase complex subunit Vid21 [Schizosaccharomyces cryophilus OY26]